MYTVDSYKITYVWKVLGVGGPWKLLEPSFECHQDSQWLVLFFFFWSALHSFFLNTNEFFSKNTLSYLSLSIPILVIKFQIKDTDWLSLNHIPAYRQVNSGQEMNYWSYSILSPGSALGSNQWYPGSRIIHLPSKP